MKIFDAQIRSDACSDTDLENLRYFDTEAVLSSAHALRDFERATDLLAYFKWLIDQEVPRVLKHGLRASVALGVLPDARPRRAHYEVWEALPALLERPEVAALGEVGAWVDERAHWELFERQVGVVGALNAQEKSAQLAIIATPPEALKINMTYKMMQRVERLGVGPKRVMMNRLDERLIETVLREGFVAGVSVGASNLNPREAARALADALDMLGSAERIVLNSASRAGGVDVLGIPKTIVALQELGVPEEAIEAMVYKNARAIFSLS